MSDDKSMTAIEIVTAMANSIKAISEANLNMNWYQDQAKQTDHYPPETRLLALITGLTSEAGECAGKVSKHLRGDERYATDEQLRDALVLELGDVLWYVAMISDCLGVDLSIVANTNIEKLKARHERDVIKGDGDDR